MLISSKKNICIFLVFSFYSFAQTTVRYIAESRLFPILFSPFFCLNLSISFLSSEFFGTAFDFCQSVRAFPFKNSTINEISSLLTVLRSRHFFGRLRLQVAKVPEPTPAPTYLGRLRLQGKKGGSGSIH